jgi:hypothetical protein
MFHTNLYVLILLLHTVGSAFCLGSAAHGDEVFTPQMRSGLSGAALKPQDDGTSGRNLRENNFRHNSANLSVAGMLSPRKIGQNDSRATKEEITERVIEENDREVLETQHATCKVTTEELVATAQATVTRVLKGLCNTSKFHFVILLRTLESMVSHIY